MANESVKDNSTRVLLNRRKEILEEISHLQQEYNAIEDVLLRLYRFEHKTYELDLESEKRAKVEALKKEQKER